MKRTRDVPVCLAKTVRSCRFFSRLYSLIAPFLSPSHGSSVEADTKYGSE